MPLIAVVVLAVLCVPTTAWCLRHRYGSTPVFWLTAVAAAFALVTPSPGREIGTGVLVAGCGLLAANGLVRLAVAPRTEPERGLTRRTWVLGQTGLALGLMVPLLAVVLAFLIPGGTSGSLGWQALVLLGGSVMAPLGADLMLARAVPERFGAASLAIAVLTLATAIPPMFGVTGRTAAVLFDVATILLLLLTAVVARIVWTSVRPRAAGAHAEAWFAAAVVTLALAAVGALSIALGARPFATVPLAVAWLVLGIAWQRTLTAPSSHRADGDWECCAHPAPVANSVVP